MPELTTPVATPAGADPSAATMQLTLREDRHLRELLEAIVVGRIAAVDTRLDGMDKALARAETIADKVPSDIDIAIKRLEQLTEKDFKGIRDLIEAEFRNLRTTAQEASQAEVRRVDAAFAAQEKSMGKTEARFEDGIKALDQQIDDLKARFDRGEGTTKGSTDQRGFIMSMASILVSIIVAIVVIANFYSPN